MPKDSVRLFQTRDSAMIGYRGSQRQLERAKQNSRLFLLRDRVRRRRSNVQSRPSCNEVEVKLHADLAYLLSFVLFLLRKGLGQLHALDLCSTCRSGHTLKRVAGICWMQEPERGFQVRRRPFCSCEEGSFVIGMRISLSISVRIALGIEGFEYNARPEAL
jgi:hypothetical protein